MAAVDARRTRRHVLLEPAFAVVAAFLGTVVAFWIQNWGIDNLGWFDYPCNDMRLGGIPLCMAPSASPGWRLVAFVAGLVGGVGLWLGIRLWIVRRTERTAGSGPFGEG